MRLSCGQPKPAEPRDGPEQPRHLHSHCRNRQLLRSRRAPAPDPTGGEQAHRRPGTAAQRPPVRPGRPRGQSHRGWPRPAAARLPVAQRARRHPPRVEQPHRRGQRPPGPGNQPSHRPAPPAAAAARLHPGASAGSAGHPVSRFGSGLRGNSSRPCGTGGDHPGTGNRRTGARGTGVGRPAGLRRRPGASAGPPGHGVPRRRRQAPGGVPRRQHLHPPYRAAHVRGRGG
ncbi:Uncharacterised protein [Pseudomonas aeruginosa]|nr:Uncharacterised protein [Pseudomonas aeruginosa]